MVITQILEGQMIKYSLETKIIKTTINEPFYKAGKILGWKGSTAGLGINHSIIKLVLKTKCRLIIHVATAGHDYWVTHDIIKHFIKNNNTEYKAGGKKFVTVLPWRIFKGFHPRPEL